MASELKLHNPAAGRNALELDLGALAPAPGHFSFEHLVAQNRRLHGISVDMSTQLLINESGRVCGGLIPVVIFSSHEDSRAVHFASPVLRDIFSQTAAHMDLSAESLSRLAGEIEKLIGSKLIYEPWQTYIHCGFQNGRSISDVAIERHENVKYFDFDKGRVGRVKTPVFAKFADGQRSSVAVSVSENKEAADVHVITDERFRGRGHALDVVGTWLEHIETRGKQAFYSHRASNVASARVAEKLGFRKIFDDIRLLQTSPKLLPLTAQSCSPQRSP